jgi:hypothetical protein
MDATHFSAKFVNLAPSGEIESQIGNVRSKSMPIRMSFAALSLHFLQGVLSQKAASPLESN